MLGVVPEEDNKTKAVVSAVKLDGIVIVSAETELKFKEILSANANINFFIFRLNLT